MTNLKYKQKVIKTLNHDLIFLTESLLTQNDPLEQYGIMDYRPNESKPRNTAIGGSMAFYAYNSHNYGVIEFETEPVGLLANVKFDGSNTRKLCVVYRPYNIRFLRFVKRLDSLLDFLHRHRKDCFIFGDFNINTLKNDSEQQL